MAGFGLALAWFLLLDLPPLPLSHGVPAPKAPLHPHPPQQPCKVSEILPTIINIIVIIIMRVILMCNCMAAESQLISMRISGLWGGGGLHKTAKQHFPPSVTVTFGRFSQRMQCCCRVSNAHAHVNWIKRKWLGICGKIHDIMEPWSSKRTASPCYPYLSMLDRKG